VGKKGIFRRCNVACEYLVRVVWSGLVWSDVRVPWPLFKATVHLSRPFINNGILRGRPTRRHDCLYAKLCLTHWKSITFGELEAD
jgi:hypothetical protein